MTAAKFEDGTKVTHPRFVGVWEVKSAIFLGRDDRSYWISQEGYGGEHMVDEQDLTAIRISEPGVGSAVFDAYGTVWLHKVGQGRSWTNGNNEWRYFDDLIQPVKAVRGK